MVVQLNHKQGGEEGIYHCEIPDSKDVYQKISIGVYSACRSEIVCTLLFCSTLLQCLYVLQKSGNHIAPLHIQSTGLTIPCLFCTECMVIMKSCALKDWFDYNQCR